MDIAEFDYELPPEYIAQEPMNPREAAKLMIVHKQSLEVDHTSIAHFPDFLHAGDVLVLNNTKVFNARLPVIILRNGYPDKKGELFLVRPMEESPQFRTVVHSSELCSHWLAIGKPGKAMSVGATIVVSQEFKGTVIEKNSDGSFIISFALESEKVVELANHYGSVPVPPYIKKIPDPEKYQTAYAKVTGSVAAPTAGFHITSALLQKIKTKGVIVTELTLHVGLGTFMPVKTNTIEEHVMHNEWVNISEETAEIINLAKKEKRRIVAVGTTTVRALEGAAKAQIRNHPSASLRVKESGSIERIHDSSFMIPDSYLSPYSGDVNLFITPGFQFQIVDALLTNFHLPKSTLLLLVSALAEKDTIHHAYKEAINDHYRFYSFGDAMFIK